MLSAQNDSLHIGLFHETGTQHILSLPTFTCSGSKEFCHSVVRRLNTPLQANFLPTPLKFSYAWGGFARKFPSNPQPRLSQQSQKQYKPTRLVKIQWDAQTGWSAGHVVLYTQKSWGKAAKEVKSGHHRTVAIYTILSAASVHTARPQMYHA